MGSTAFPVALTVVALLVLGAFPGVFAASGGPEGGAGGRAVVLVKTVNDLQNMGKQENADYELANDIDASATKNWNSGAGFAPLGSYQKSFTGTLDGKGFRITGLYINRPSLDLVGLFGVIYRNGGFVRNLTLEDVDITGGNGVGAIAGNNTVPLSGCHVTGKVSGKGGVGGIAGGSSSATISRCSFRGTVTASGSGAGGLAGGGMGTTTDCYTSGTVSGADSTGGFVGSDWKGKITRCMSSCTVSGTSQVGGFVGFASGNITECYSTGKVTGTDEVGGFVGHNDNENGWQGEFRDCYSTGAVFGKSRVGGFAGYNKFTYGDGARFVFCYSVGTVRGTSDVGGFLGKLDGGNAVDCHWDTNTSGPGGSAAGTGNSTAEMMMKATFVNWDFATVWHINENLTYPTLRRAPAGPPNSIPVITTSAVTTAAAGGTYRIQYHATDADGDVLNWSLSTNASWLSMSVDGLLSGSPTAADTGTYHVEISVTDGKFGKALQNFSLEVSENREPVILAASGPGEKPVQSNKAVAFSVDVSDPDRDVLTYDWQEGGQTLSRERSFARRFSPGNHTVVLLIGDGHYVLTRTFNFTVTPAPDTIDTGPAAIPGFGVAAAAGTVAVAAALFWRRERR